MKKKLLGIAAVAAALALAAFVLVGCGSSSSSAASSSASGSGSAESSAASSGASASGVFRTLDEIKASGKIVIGVFSDKHPFGYVDEGGEYAGYDVELANRLAKDLGVEVEFVSTEAANRVEYLETGKVDVILANFTVTDERAQKVDFCDAYMNVALGVVSHNDKVIKSLDEIGDGEVIVITGTTAETYLTENNPEIKLKKFETYANAKTAFENKEGVAWANDNTEVIAFANAAEGYTVGIEELGSLDTIAPAVSKGNTTLRDWINEDMEKLGAEKFFHAAYEKTLMDVYGADYEETLVVEPSK
ncbi:MAG: transporter substrate-binding domain-containing protein [Eggerthellaceae bacterium]|nr:transporter substrate-binding domain-containing protein [Eggerthellaceae bacterium]